MKKHASTYVVTAIIAVICLGIAMCRHEPAQGTTIRVQEIPPVGTKPVYRFWNGRQKCHFYTISESEKQKLIDKYSNVWTYEGPVFYAWPVPAEIYE